MRLLRLVLSIMLPLAVVVPLAAQVDPEYVIPKTNPNTSPADVTRGEQLFKGQCAGCHGPKGEGGRGAVLAQPRLRRAVDDESLFRTIRDGVRGTEMPGADTITSREIWQMASYVRSLATPSAARIFTARRVIARGVTSWPARALPLDRSLPRSVLAAAPPGCARLFWIRNPFCPRDSFSCGWSLRMGAGSQVCV